jgi:hypothetical protein
MHIWVASKRRLRNVDFGLRIMESEPIADNQKPVTHGDRLKYINFMNCN